MKGSGPGPVPLGRALLPACLAIAGGQAAAADPELLSPVEVRARADSLLGESAAGSEGVVSGSRLQASPLLRPGDALETVPGLIATQHAGDGKANQYFLRGFDLDHGTDFAAFVAGVPVNMPSHAHGQGYADLNFLIPELVEQIRFRKGSYYAEEGDFASVGSARIDYARRLDSSLARLGLGPDGYARGLLAGSPRLGNGRLLYGFEWFHNDGPWQVHENYRKLNGVLRYSQGEPNGGISLTAMAYEGDWTSTDQVAQRAIDRGLIDRFGSLDPSTGGRVRRYSLSGDWAARGRDSQTRASAWWLSAGLDLWSNFQYCLNRGCPPGDQFKQAEQRRAGGVDGSHTVYARWGGMEVENSAGLQARLDSLRPVGLYATRDRTILETRREDRVEQESLSLWLQSEVRWKPWLRSIAGLRGDAYGFRVDSSFPANSGRASARMLTPKLSLAFGPWRKAEFYLNYGHGFHSNDARGTTVQVDPADGVTPVDRVKPLVRSRGREAGLRSEALPGWQTTLAVWQMDMASDLVFVGDAGTTEATRPSRRRGLEWTNRYGPAEWVFLEADLSWSRARFRDGSPAVGDFIPGAIAATAHVGIGVEGLGPWSGLLRLRHFGPRPLDESGSVRSAASTLANLRLGYRFDRQVEMNLDVFNLFDRRLNDIEYWYASRLPGETASQFDRHVHPAEPRTWRFALTYRFP